jgi:chemotaxis protein MotB
LSDGKDEIKAPEILIIKRNSGNHDEEHHGGVWKIAYADFMTAMMAFFLVMWLVNSTDKETLTQVATYFNPIKLTDRSTSAKGIRDLDEGAVGKLEGSPKDESKQEAHAKKDDHAKKESKSSKKEESSKKESKKEADKPQPSAQQSAEAQMFADPMATLDSIAAKAGPRGAAGSKAGQVTGENSGALYRDPFDPNFWRSNQSRPAVRNDAQANKGGASKREAGEAGGAVPNPDGAGAGRTAQLDSEPAAKGGAPAQPGADGQQAGGESVAAAPQPAPTVVEVQKATEPNVTAEAQAQAKQLAQDIGRALGRANPGQTPHLEVVATSEGLLVSLTDEFDFGMFSVGSAEPKPELVVVMEKIAGVLAKRPGELVVRGHTDARPYKSAVYDNWRLSTARAHMASYMLVRGGIPETRIERVEGYADRKLKLASDPVAAQNRRIEILLRTGKS